MKVYSSTTNVLQAARERMSMLFDNFEHINVSVSSGKDSTVCFWLALQEARKRDRKIQCFFLDQEAEYENSIKIIEQMMTEKNVIPYWFQVPVYLTNATSSSDFFLYAWGENEKWMREKSPIAITHIDEEYPKRFYEFFPWFEDNRPDTAYIVGLRAEEGIMRFRAVTKYPGWNGLRWSTSSKNSHRFYPIYDWGYGDVWRFIYEYDLPYNKIYDLMFMDNYSYYTKMRVSNLVHEKSYKCLVDLPKYEPETYNSLCKRISGIATAARYASEKLVFSNKKLPEHYKCWKEFRDFLLENIKDAGQREKYITRFARQATNERIYQAQVGQLLINDYENSRAFNTNQEAKVKEKKEKWQAIL